jgi:membrane protease YdiL (CAAX protease family)
MSVRTSQFERRPQLAAWVMLPLWLIYTFIYTFPFERNIAALLEAVAGTSGVLALLLLGFPSLELYLQLKPISKKGWIALGLATLALLGPLASARWQGMRWLPFFVYAPLSGITQELFFRASLLPAIQRLCGGKTWRPLILHSVLFGLWHVPLAYLASPISPWVSVIALFVVTSLAGLAWGWQVQHDRTVIWSMVHHSILLMVMSLFGL